MKPLLLLTLLATLFFVNAKGQDTTKKSAPRFKPEPPLRMIFHPFTENPQAYQREHHYQDSIRRAALPPEMHHPTLYLDGGFGAGLLGEHGVQGNYSLNYQYDRSLFTFRGIDIAAYRYNPHQILNIFPDQVTNSLDQYAFLYGWRFTNHRNRAYSFSLGVAADDRTIYFDGDNSQRLHTSSTYAGLPFEADYQWYTRRFGVSFGLKLTGDVSQHSFFGFGVDIGLGFHNSK